MHHTVKNIMKINEKVKKKILSLNYTSYLPKIIAVSKPFQCQILPLINYGHKYFGENKVQSP